MPLALNAARPLEGEIVHDLPEGVRRLTRDRHGVHHGGYTPDEPRKPPLRDRIPRVQRARLTGRGAAALSAAALAPMTVRDTQRLRAHPDRRPSAGRLIAGAQFGAYHAATVGKPGQKSRAVAGLAPAAAIGYVANQHALRQAAPHLMGIQRAMTYGHPVGPHLRGAGKAMLPAFAVQSAAGALATRHNASLGRYKEQTMAKSDTVRADASVGRYLAGTALPGWHGAVAGRPGRKLRAVGTEVAPAAIAAPAVMALATRGHTAAIGPLRAAQLAGHVGAVNRNQRKGNYKPQATIASKRLTAVRKDMLPTQVRYVVQRTPDGRYAGNGTGLTFVQVVTKHPTSAVVVGSGGRGRSGGRAPVSKANPLRTLRALATGAGRRTTPEAKRGLEQIAALPKPTGVPKIPTGGLSGRLPQLTSASRGRRLG